MAVLQVYKADGTSTTRNLSDAEYAQMTGTKPVSTGISNIQNAIKPTTSTVSPQSSYLNNTVNSVQSAIQNATKAPSSNVAVLSNYNPVTGQPVTKNPVTPQTTYLNNSVSNIQKMIQDTAASNKTATPATKESIVANYNGTSKVNNQPVQNNNAILQAQIDSQNKYTQAIQDATTKFASVAPTDNSAQYTEMYNQQLIAQQTKLKQAIAQAQQKYQTIATEAPQQFQGQKNQIEVNRYSNLNNLRENLANAGQNANAGVSRTETTQVNTSAENNLNNIEIAQNKIISDAKMEIANLQAQGLSQEAELVATNAASRIQALIDEKNRVYEATNQVNQTNLQNIISGQKFGYEADQTAIAQKKALQDKLKAENDAYNESVQKIYNPTTGTYENDQAKTKALQDAYNTAQGKVYNPKTGVYEDTKSTKLATETKTNTENDAYYATLGMVRNPSTGKYELNKSVIDDYQKSQGKVYDPITKTYEQDKKTEDKRLSDTYGYVPTGIDKENLLAFENAMKQPEFANVYRQAVDNNAGGGVQALINQAKESGRTDLLPALEGGRLAKVAQQGLTQYSDKYNLPPAWYTEAQKQQGATIENQGKLIENQGKILSNDEKELSLYITKVKAQYTEPTLQAELDKLKNSLELQGLDMYTKKLEASYLPEKLKLDLEAKTQSIISSKNSDARDAERLQLSRNADARAEKTANEKEDKSPITMSDAQAKIKEFSDSLLFNVEYDSMGALKKPTGLTVNSPEYIARMANAIDALPIPDKDIQALKLLSFTTEEGKGRTVENIAQIQNFDRLNNDYKKLTRDERAKKLADNKDEIIGLVGVYYYNQLVSGT